MINRSIWTVLSLGVAILTFLAAVPADTAALQPNRVDVEYVPPKSSAHDEVFKLVRERRLLEKMRDLLVPFRLPRRLLLKTVGCDGEVNAWYDDGAITVCYEFLDWVWQSAPQQTTLNGIAPIDTMAGSVSQIILHEAGHAVFNLLRVPIFGPEEDDADQFSAYVIMQMGKEAARRLIAGAAYQYRGGVQSENQNISTKRLADVHATMTQRFFNILCLAYGADNELFKDVVAMDWIAKGGLPKERAEGCNDEYAQVAYAFKTLIGPYVDRKLAANFHKNWLPPINFPVPRRSAGMAAKSPE